MSAPDIDWALAFKDASDELDIMPGDFTLGDPLPRSDLLKYIADTSGYTAGELRPLLVDAVSDGVLAWADGADVDNPIIVLGLAAEMDEWWPAELLEMAGGPESEPKSSKSEGGRQAPSDRRDAERRSEVDPDAESRWRDCLAEVIDWFHARIDDTIGDHSDRGEHPDRPSTAREYYHEKRGWSDETIEAYKLGWAPADPSGLVNHLMEVGFNCADMDATGLFSRLTANWRGRYVLPYFVDGTPVYAISRATGREGGGAAGYDGHPADFMPGKYIKPAHTKDWVRVEEPIFGVDTVRAGEPVIITEGIADAITAQVAGHGVLSPVTTTFKGRHVAALGEVIEDVGADGVYIINDAEPLNAELADEDDSALAPGEKGAVRTAELLSREIDVPIYIGELPREDESEKVDVDDFLRSGGDLTAVMASATPAEEHESFIPGLGKGTRLGGNAGRATRL